jgi:predicted 3-demethylubiquinone-9 3-methyltransferase (glyoxalase superfamily)
MECAKAAEFDRLYDALVDAESPYDIRYSSSSGQWARFTDRYGLRWELSSPE